MEKIICRWAAIIQEFDFI